MPRTLLIPALLDDWFPLLRHAFASREWEPVLLREERGLADRGLRYFHNELCYPVFLVAGQVLAALESGEYDPAACGVLMGQAGDECRGSCGIRLMRKALDKAGYPEVKLLSLNVRGIDRDTGLPITPAMIRRALAAAVWGDVLAIARNQVRPCETRPGSAEALWRRWICFQSSKSSLLSGGLREDFSVLFSPWDCSKTSLRNMEIKPSGTAGWLSHTN